jgi:hypothetical protein
MKRVSSVLKAPLRWFLFHRGNSWQQFLRHGKGLHNLSNVGVFAPREGGDNVPLSFTVSLIVTFTKGVTVLWDVAGRIEP